MSSELLKYLSDKVNEEISRMGNDLMLGGAKDHGDYKWVCGIIRGLTMANTIIVETAQRMKEEEDAD
jgi:hypothetical protein